MYRQDEKRVVKTANVVVPISIELVGSDDAIAEAEAKLADFGDQITIVKKVDDTVKQAFVFDVDSDQAAELESIAELLGYEVGSILPASIVPGDQTEIIIAVVVEQTPATSTPTQEP